MRRFCRATTCSLIFLSCWPCATASAQDSIFRLFNNIIREAAIDHARKDWSRIPPDEAACLETAFEKEGSSIDILIGRGIRPKDRSIARIRQDCKAANTIPAETTAVADGAEHLSNGPTFDCSKAKSATGRIICMDQEGAAADWNMISASWAARFSLPESDRKTFDDAEERWLISLNGSCHLNRGQATYTSRQRQCVVRAYKDKADQYRKHLSGDALDESNLSPEDHAQLQRSLISRGFLQGDADGEFGEDTRAAIVRYHQDAGASGGVFLSANERADLSRKLGSSTAEAVQSATKPSARKEIAALRRSRIFLEDVKTFIGSRQNTANIIAIAAEVDVLKSAIDHSDEVAANDSRRKLADLLMPIPGYSEFASATEKAREKTQKDKFDQAKQVLSKNAAFIDAYIARHLGDDRIPDLIKLRQNVSQLSNTESVEEIERANAAVESYATSNGMTEEYAKAGLGPGADLLRKQQIAMQQKEEEEKRRQEVEKQRIEEEQRAAEQKAAAEEESRRAAEAERRRVAEQKAAEEERQRRAAEVERAKRLKEVAEKGKQYAQDSGTSWSLQQNKNEMTDHVDISVTSKQSNDAGAVAEITGLCEKRGSYNFTATFVDTDGQPIQLVTTPNYGAEPVLAEDIRINDEPSKMAIFTTVNYSNVLLIAHFTSESIDTKNFLAFLTRTINLQDTWRVMTEVKTNRGSVLIKIPLFDNAIQKMISTCN